jgi:hypothetical protein
MRGSRWLEAGSTSIVVACDQVAATWTCANLVNQYVPTENTASSPRRHRARAATDPVRACTSKETNDSLQARERLWTRSKYNICLSCGTRLPKALLFRPPDACAQVTRTSLYS